MSFFEQQFDPRLSFGARGGPVWSTAVARVHSGRRSANRNWAAPLHRYNVAHAVKTNDDFEIVRAFFYVVSGAYDGFRFKDWSDYEATRSNSALAFVSGTEWQMQRAYTVGSRTYLRDISKPCASPAPVVWRLRSGSWSTVTPVGSPTPLDYTTGIVSITDHVVGDTYAWVGEFDVPVTFAEDEMEAEIVDAGPGEYLVRWPQIVVEEVRL
jgi:uncharacterized protein (TIGR02217 family)